MKKISKLLTILLAFLICFNLFEIVVHADSDNLEEVETITEEADTATEETENNPEETETTIAETEITTEETEITTAETEDFSEEPILSDNEDFEIENGVLNKYTGEAIDIVIPEGVTEIATYAFLGSKVERVSFPKSLKRIDKYAFYNATHLEHIELQEGLEFIGNSAFYLSPLKELTLPDSVTEIEEFAFTSAKFESVNIPRNFKCASMSINPRGLFYRCNNLREIIFPEGIENFENFLTGAPGIKTLTIPASVNTIVGAAFHRCTDLEEITFLGTTPTIESDAFNNCPSLKKVTFKDVNTIERSTFYLCGSLTDIEFGDHLCTIGESIFRDCTSLQTIVLPAPLAAIPDNAFQDCTSLTDVYIPDSVTSISASAFPVSSELTLHGGKGSYTETFAAENGYIFAEDNNTVRVTAAATDSGNHVKITWTAVPGAEKYAIARIDSNNNYSTIVKDITSPEYEFDDPVFAKTNKYIVRIYKDGKYQNFLPADAVSPFSANPTDISTLNYYNISDVTYTGSAFTPNAYIYKDNSEARLRKGIDYTISYTNNVNVGTASAIVTGCGDYKGTVTFNFNIKPKSLASYSTTISEISPQKYTGSNLRPSFTVTVSDHVLQYGIDYTAEYRNNRNVGTAQIIIRGNKNYCDSNGTVFTIIKADPPAAPGNLTGINPTKKKGSDGKITGVTTAMEYSVKSDFSSDVKNCTSTSVTGLKAGTYYIRFKATDNVNAGKIASVSLNDPIFNDVADGVWYTNAIKFVYDNNIMSGKGDYFKPNDNITREEFVQVLYNHAGKPAVSGNNVYSDVSKTAYYYNAVLWAKNNNIANGKTKDGKIIFGVGQNITREEIAQMLYQYAKIKNYKQDINKDAFNEFTDSNKYSSWAETSLKWAVTQGIISGKGTPLRLDARANATRAECASMIKKMLEANQ